MVAARHRHITRRCFHGAARGDATMPLTAAPRGGGHRRTPSRNHDAARPIRKPNPDYRVSISTPYWCSQSSSP